MKRLSYIGFALITSCVQYHPDPVKTAQVDQWKDIVATADEATLCPPPSVQCETSTISPWWTIYNDDLLNSLEAESIKNSPTIQQAIGKLKEAEAFYGINRSEQFPHLNLDVGYQRSRISQTQPASSLLSQNATSSGLTGLSGDSDSVNIVPPMNNGSGNNSSLLPGVGMPVVPPPPGTTTPPATATAPKPSHHITALSVLPEVSYEFDFWGKFWQQSESALYQMKAQQEDLNTALLLLTTNVADTYLQLRTYDNEITVLEDNYKSRDKAYTLQKVRYKSGLINNLDVQRAKVEVASIEAELENTKRLRVLLENMLAVLVGVPASDFHVEKADVHLYTPTIPAGLPSSLLENRPDIRSASHLIEAGRLNVGVAKTAFFPAVTLFGDYGFLANKPSNLFKWKSHVWSLTIDALTPIYDAGKNINLVRQAVAQYEQAVAAYLDRVLTAFREVEDALASVNSKKTQLKYLKEQVIAAQEVLKLSITRYDMGLVDYLDVVDAERSALEAERIEVQVQREQFSTTVSLIKALGGTWGEN